jgi:2-dehydro-3-deoxyglucarate aldolase/4-hydroxy-2-oxoheptanedioate aldolase
MGVMVPMVETREQAEFIVSCTRYPPLGRRGSAFGVVAHDDYTEGGAADKMAAIHARTLVICLIETAKAIENVDIDAFRFRSDRLYCTLIEKFGSFSAGHQAGGRKRPRPRQSGDP